MSGTASDLFRKMTSRSHVQKRSTVRLRVGRGMAAVARAFLALAIGGGVRHLSPRKARHGRRLSMWISSTSHIRTTGLRIIRWSAGTCSEGISTSPWTRPWPRSKGPQSTSSTGRPRPRWPSTIGGRQPIRSAAGSSCKRCGPGSWRFRRAPEPNADAQPPAVANYAALASRGPLAASAARAALQDDVNGFPRAGAMALLDRRIHYLFSGINADSGGPPLPRPSAFWWKMPDGRKLFVWLGYSYPDGFSFFNAEGWRRGPVPAATDTRYRPPRPDEILRSDEASVRKAHACLVGRVRALRAAGYRYPTLLISMTNEWRMDNDPPFPP